MRKKITHCVLALAAFTLFLLLPVRAEAADYQMTRTGTRMTCMDKETGRQVTSAFITYKGYTYYFDADGYAHTGWMKQGKDYYFFNANGAMVKNQWVGQYYLQKSGKMAVSKWISKGVYVGQDGKRIPGYQKKTRAKFIRNKKGLRYRNYDGSYSKKTWQCIRGNWYYFYSTGYMATSRKIGSYYVDRTGRMLVNRSVRIKKYRYDYGPDGRLVKKAKVKH